MEASLITLCLFGLSKAIPFLKCVCKSDDVALIMPTHSGKSNLLNSLDINYKNKYIFADINADVWNSLKQDQKEAIQNFQNKKEYNNLNLYVLPIYKDYMTNLKEKFPNKRICYLFSDISLAKQLGIKFFYYVIPSQRYLDQICNGKAENVVSEIRESVNKILQLKSNKAIIVNSFDDLLSHIQKSFNIKLKY